MANRFNTSTYMEIYKRVYAFVYQGNHLRLVSSSSR